MGTHVTSADYFESHSEPAVMPNREGHSSGVAWGAVIGGAFVICALYLILLALGAGFGLLAVSPWSGAGISASTAGTAAIIWMIVVEIIACAFGGYLTGRLRTKWTVIHTDEVFFRDTANGFLAWAVAFVASAALLASAAAAMSGVAMQGAAGPDGGPMTAASAPAAYFADTLFRSDRPGAETRDPAIEAEAERILASGLEQGVTQTDQTYLARQVAARTGISQSDADRRVSDAIAHARQAVDDARKATAHFLLWLFVSLLIGAFTASFAATIGGRQRDHVRPL